MLKKGHLRLVPKRKKLTKEIKNSRTKRTSGKVILLCRKRQTLCKDNPEKSCQYQKQFKIIAINNLETEKLLKNTNPSSPVMVITPPIKNIRWRRFPTFFTVEYGIMDSVKIDLKSENTLDQKLVTEKKNQKKIKEGKTDKNLQKKKKPKTTIL